MKHRYKTIFTGILLTGFMMVSPLQAQEHGSKTHGHTKEPAKKESAHKPSKSGHQKGHSQHKGGLHLFSPDWHGTLSEHQKVAVDEMHLRLMKDTAAIKAMITVKKTELAVLATQDHAKLEAMNKKIDEILDLKRQKIRARYAHIIEMREMLSPEQRISYDMRIISQAAGRKK
ncbi:MAG: periplasmic heavy metal sensor [Nitrospirae bacterium]|nr:periplasmic heavy metal sensor [Candidatus Manganitrophaceae bacterium]